MIELTQDQVLALSEPRPGPARLFDPRTHESFVLLRSDDYAKLVADQYDDSPWTRDELEAIARHTAESVGWDVEAEDTSGPR